MATQKTLLVIIISFLTLSVGMAQTAMLSNGQKVYRASDMESLPDGAPNFDGGPEALSEFFQQNLIYPDLAKKQGREGTVVLEFEINKDGKINDIIVTEPLSDELNEEAIRLVEKMPHWRPAYQNGKAQTVKFQLPIVFELKN